MGRTLSALFGSSADTQVLAMDGDGNVSGNDAYCQMAHGGPACRDYKDMLKHHPAFAEGYRSGLSERE